MRASRSAWSSPSIRPTFEPDVPLNVERFINIFLSKDVLGGGDIKPTQGFKGHYASYDLAQHDEISHISIDKMDQIHQQLVAKIVQLSATPVKDDGDPFPLRYAVPPKVDIELWDSGMAVAARAGDTLQTLAERYHLPLWSLTQANPMPENAALMAGQRIIVPRHSGAARRCFRADFVRPLAPKPPQKRHDHRHTTAIGSVGLRTKLGGQETFLHARLLPFPERDQERTDERAPRRNRGARGQNADDQAGIDRMAHQPIGSGIHDAVVFLVGDGVGPESPEMDARPPGKRDTQQKHHGQRIGADVAGIVDPALPQRLRRPGRQQDRPEQNLAGDRPTNSGSAHGSWFAPTRTPPRPN